MLVAAVRNIVDTFSRNRDAGTVPLDGPVVAHVFDRMLARAEAIGAVRGRSYLQERIGRFIDVWKQWQAAPDQALGCEKTIGGQAILRGLLHRAGSGAWDDQTGARSMRETGRRRGAYPTGTSGEHADRGRGPVQPIPQALRTAMPVGGTRRAGRQQLTSPGVRVNP
jgi:hypothetical protein